MAGSSMKIARSRDMDDFLGTHRFRARAYRNSTSDAWGMLHDSAASWVRSGSLSPRGRRVELAVPSAFLDSHSMYLQRMSMSDATPALGPPSDAPCPRLHPGPRPMARSTDSVNSRTSLMPAASAMPMTTL
jgi:hypothetical protein